MPDPVNAGGLRVKILDFGIAKLRPEQSVGGAAMTRAGTTMGSPAYMAPEQCYELGQVGDRADVYALGIILYELLTGRPPFVAEMPAEVIVMQAKATPPPLKQLAPTSLKRWLPWCIACCKTARGATFHGRGARGARRSAKQ